MTSTYSSSRAAFRAGAVDALPLAIPGIPFGLILGLAITASPIDPIVGWFGAWMIAAGAAQLTLTTLLTDGVATLAAVGAAIVVNLRHLMYSMAMATQFQGQPRWFRWIGSHGLLDQVFALSDQKRHLAPEQFRAYYGGAFVMMMGPWSVFVAVGLTAGGQVPESWNLAVAVPVLFVGLVVLGIRSMAGVVAASVAFVVAVTLSHLPNRVGLLIGAVAGVALAALVPLPEEKAT